MTIRALNAQGDWLFGQSLNNYLSANAAVQEDIRTRLLCFIGDCFFDTIAGINWFGLIGGKDTLAIQLAVSSVLLNTQNVTGILQLSIDLSEDRIFSISYQVQTTYSVTGDIFQYNLIGAV